MLKHQALLLLSSSTNRDANHSLSAAGLYTILGALAATDNSSVNGRINNLSSVKISDSSIGGSLTFYDNSYNEGVKLNADNVTIGGYTNLRYGNASFDNSTFNSEIRIYGSSSNDVRASINNSTINSNIRQKQFDDSTGTVYKYRDYNKISMDGNTITGDVEMVSGTWTLDNSSAQNLYLYAANLNSTNGTLLLKAYKSA